MIPLPEPVIVPVVPMYDMSGGRMILEGASGRLWVVEFDRHDPQLQPTAISLPDFLPSTYRDACVWRQLVGDRLLVKYEGDVRVLSLTKGQALLSLSHMDHGCEAVCLTPDGGMLFVVRANGDD